MAPHGDYRSVYSVTRPRSVIRDELGIPPDATVLAVVGWLRAYKGLADLVDAFAGVPDEDVYLLLAGRPKNGAIDRELLEASESHPRLIYRPGFIAHDNMGDLVNAVDLGVLPFRRILNSGSAILFLSFNRPVWVPDLPQFRELGDAVGRGWVNPLDRTMSAESLLRAARRTPPHLPPSLDALAWSRHGREQADLYSRVLGSASRR